MLRLMFTPGFSPGDPDAPAGSMEALAAENAALRAQVRRATGMVNSAVDHAIITMDAGGFITGWNRGAQCILGYGEAEVLGRSGEVVFTAEDRAIDRFATEMRLALDTGSAVNERWHVRRDGTRFWASGTMLPLLEENGQPNGFLNILRDRTSARAEVERRELLMTEMNHRIRNIFATVQAVAMLTERHTPDPAAFRAAFDARLQVLARLNDVLIKADWSDAPLHEMVESALEAYGGEAGRITVKGPAVLVAANLAVPISLVFHELTTNAVKHGALSVPQGRVVVSWTITPACHGASLVNILWREQNGPPVQQPARRGFGSRLLEQSLPPKAVHLDFQPCGLECSIVLNLVAASQAPEH